MPVKNKQRLAFYAMMLSKSSLGGFFCARLSSYFPRYCVVIVLMTIALSACASPAVSAGAMAKSKPTPKSFAAASCQLAHGSQDRAERVTIKRVLDGDTVILGDGRRVRLIGINAPEIAHTGKPAEPLGDAATVKLLRWQGRQAWLQVGFQPKDHYGRTLGHLFSADGDNLIAILLAQGMGFQVTLPPNDRYQACYRLAAEHARVQRLGVWGHRYHRVREASDKTALKKGFGRFRGQVSAIKVTRNKIWITLYGDVVIHVRRKDREALSGKVLSALLTAVDEGRVADLPPVIFSGWLQDRMEWGSRMRAAVQSGQRQRWQISIRHRNHWQFVEH